MDTVGQALKQARERAKLSVADVAHAIRANVHYVEAIERGNLDVFPAPVYAHGFIRLYAELVGEDVRRLELACRAQPAPPAAVPDGRSKKGEGVAAPLQPVPPPPSQPVREDVRVPAETAEPTGGDAAGGPGAAVLRGLRRIRLTPPCDSLADIRLPVETWKTLLLAAGMALLAIVAAAALGWYFLSGPGADTPVPETQWLAEPPAPYLDDGQPVSGR